MNEGKGSENAWAKRKSNLRSIVEKKRAHCLLQPGPMHLFSFTTFRYYFSLKNKKMMRKCESFELEDTLKWRKDSSMWLCALHAKALEIEAKFLTVVKIQLVATGHPRWPFGGMGMSLYLCATIPLSPFRNSIVTSIIINMINILILVVQHNYNCHFNCFREKDSLYELSPIKELINFYAIIIIMEFNKIFILKVNI